MTNFCRGAAVKPGISTRDGCVHTVTRIDPETLRGSRESWNTLAATMPYPTTFCSWEWIYTWWQHFGRGREPWILFIHRDGQLKGILPLFCERRWLHRDARIGRVLGYCGVPELFPDPLDIISAENNAVACMNAVLEYLRQHSGDWDVLHLRFWTRDSFLVRGIRGVEDMRLPEKILPSSLTPLPEGEGSQNPSPSGRDQPAARWPRIARRNLLANTGSWVGEGVREFFGTASKTIRVESVSAAPYIAVTGNYEQYLQTLSSNERSNVRRRRRKLIEGQRVTYTDFSSEEPQRALQRLFDLHDRRAKQKEIHSTFGGPDISAFHRALLVNLDRNQVWLRGLQKGQEVIAVFYGYTAGSCIAYYQLGFDPEWSDLSPGSVLLQETIREAHDRGFKEYNFLQGEEGFKYRWTREFRPLYAVDLFNRSLFGRLSRFLITVKRLLRRTPVAAVAGLYG